MAKRGKSAAKKRNVIKLEVKFKLNVNIVLEEVADHGNVDTAAFWEDLDIQLGESRESKLVKINERNDCCGKGWICPRGSDFVKSVHVKGIVIDILQVQWMIVESIEKWLKLSRRKTIPKTEKMLNLYHKLW